MKVKHAARPGITGAGRDYEVYDADMREKLTGACIGGVAGGTASYIAEHYYCFLYKCARFMYIHRVFEEQAEKAAATAV